MTAWPKDKHHNVEIDYKIFEKDDGVKLKDTGHYLKVIINYEYIQ